jgi:peptidoglycan hydrolase-like protein with peptidoglycan-binding domain
MQPIKRILSHAALGAAITFTAATTSQAQRVVLPQNSVILVRTTTALESSTMRQGETFETTVEDNVGIDGYSVIPQGSRIRGVVTYVQPATRAQSGVIEVDFDRLTLSDGTSYAIQGRLTSTDPNERRQIDSMANQRVVFVGGRSGIGAAIAGAGSQSRSTSNIFTALGSLLSEGRNVSVPAGTQLAVQLEQSVSLRRRNAITNPDESTLYTSTDVIRAAQRALAAQNYYRGSIDGQMTYATQRALFQYQSDKGLSATGNLDWRTARSLGISLSSNTSGSIGGSNILSATAASTLRRNAQNLTAAQRQQLSVSSIGRLNANRAYQEGDINLWFALSAFTDNAELYEQIVAGNVNSDAAVTAGRALVEAARRVDAALQYARTSQSIRNSWSTIRSQLNEIDSSY